MNTKIIVKGLPIILILAILQPMIYFLWDWFKDWNYPLYTVIGSLALVFIIFFLGRLLSPSLEKLDDRVFLVAVLLVFGLTRLIWIVTIPTLPISDFHMYNELGKTLASGQLLTTEIGKYINGWVYPIFLGLLYKIFGSGNITAVKFINLLFGLISVYLVYSLGKAVAGEKAARWATILFIFWPVQWMYTNNLATEHLALPMMLGGMLLVIRAFRIDSRPWLYAALGGSLLAVGANTRPTILLCLAVAILITLITQRPIIRMLVILGTLIGSYVLVNIIYLGGLYVFNDKNLPDSSHSIGMNLFMGARYPNGMWHPEDAETVFTWPEDEYMKYALDASLQRLASYSPSQLAFLALQKNYIFWGLPYYGYYWSTVNLANPDILTRLPNEALSVSQYLYQLLVLFAAVWGAVKFLLRGYPYEVGYVILILILAALLHIVWVTDSRYLYVFEPLLFIIAANGLTRTHHNADVSEIPFHSTVADVPS